jgi:hypothetical protein
LQPSRGKKKMDAKLRLLKSKLEIKRQLKYVKEEAQKVKEKFPDNQEAYNSWNGMAEAYNLALQILEGEEL